MEQAFLDGLRKIVGQQGLKDGSQVARYNEDPRGRFKGNAQLVVRPETTDQVAKIVTLCNDARVGIIPFSGGTGVVAGQLVIEDTPTLVLSLDRMNRVREISTDDSVLVAEAGCVLENIHAAAEEHDLVFPLNMASKGSCCIGGNLATNAGGIQVVRHGNARDLCLGLEAVLPDGSVYSDLSPLRKNNTGYDLRHLLIGSEGTLGIITAATLVLKPADPETATALCAIATPAAALDLYKHLRKQLGEGLSALELMSGFGLKLVFSQFPSLTSPFRASHKWVLLVEAGGALGITEKLEAALAECFEKELVFDAVVAQSAAQRQSLWNLRENTPEANRLAGAFCNSDTSVPISKVGAFIECTRAKVSSVHPDLRINTYGHIGDGNIHQNVLPPDGISKESFLEANAGVIEAVRMAINDATMQFDGSISAEHGIGRLKKADLKQYAPRHKLGAIKKIKQALDPNNIMNPGAIIG